MSWESLKTQLEQFIFIVNSTQTKDFHTWNTTALHHAWDWTLFVQQASMRADAETISKIDDAFRYDTLPSWSSSTQFSLSLLHNAPRDFLRALVCSPYLVTHPLRSELFQTIAYLYPQLPPTNEHRVSPSFDLLDDLMTRLQLQRTASVLTRLGATLTDKLTTVSVAGRAFHIPSLSSWKMSASTLSMLALAHGLHRQTLSRLHHDASSWSVCSTQLGGMFNDSHATDDAFCLGKEIVVQAALFEWPDEAARQRLVDLIQQSVTDMPTRMLEISPWLASQLCEVIPSLAIDYVACVVAHSTDAPARPWPKVSLKERLGCLLACQHPQLTAFCEKCIVHGNLLEMLAPQP
ncbi:Aste57867_25433 [Aphanomyces stellatus]|uniref:Aste57867_25433 protein n=1 Tax=Aphanomyces stellatus TaxID=120398 RepID=A0A485LTS5_9STRA|nr:hypothetical protein As57867_025354 [Aphanomyces stellatus]VFU02056.1 Aste57867_25433 [Aphanomyces stellatus]